MMKRIFILTIVVALLGCQKKDCAVLRAVVEDVRIVCCDSMILIHYNSDECDTLKQRDDGFYDGQNLVLSTDVEEKTVSFEKGVRKGVTNIRKIDDHNFISSISDDLNPLASTWFVNYFYDESYNVFRIERSCSVTME